MLKISHVILRTIQACIAHLNQVMYFYTPILNWFFFYSVHFKQTTLLTMERHTCICSHADPEGFSISNEVETEKCYE